MKWTIGKVEIFQLVELDAGKIIQNIIKEATPKNIQEMSWLYPYFADEAGNLKALVQSFLIKSDNKYILVDTCNGNDKVRTDFPEWANLQTDFLKNLNKIGLTEKNIDIVVCTHFHCDHIGWNTRLKNNQWVPTFPKEKYLFVQKEYEYWKQKPGKEYSDDKAAFHDSITPILKAGLSEFVEANHRIDQHVSFIPTSGHTPGHVAVLIESQNQRAIISGDIFYHPCQIAKQEWAIEANTFPDQAKITRQLFLKKIADTPTLLIGSHFANPVAGRVVRVGGGFIFKA